MLEQDTFEENSLKWPLVGNKQVSDFLFQTLVKRDPAGSYIFLGPDNLGKTTVAKFFVKSLLCQKGQPASCEQCPSCQQMNHKGEEDSLSAVHSDYYLVKKEEGKKNISIEQIRDFNKILSMSSFLNSYKTGIIKEAESLSQEAANALLKTLEEPKRKVVIILIASNLESVPATLASRSQILNFYPVSTEEIYDHLLEEHQVSRSVAKNISRLSLGRPALAVKFLEDQEFLGKHRDRAEMFLDSLAEPDANSRIKSLNNFLGEKASGQEGAGRALNLIEIWRALARDILLINHQNKNLIQHQIFKEKLEKISERFDNRKSLKLIALLQTAEKQVKENVNPRLAVENILFNLN